MSEFTYPPELEIVPLAKPPGATVTVPGSKSITNRARVLAGLMARQGRRILGGPLRSEDTEVMLDCLGRLGFEFRPLWTVGAIGVGRLGGREIIPATSADLFVGNSGTTVRFLTAMLSLGRGRYRLDGVPRMRERPIQDLLDALGQLGVRATSEAGNGCPPVILETGGWRGSAVLVRGGMSSQFLSGLMLAAPLAYHETVRGFGE